MCDKKIFIIVLLLIMVSFNCLTVFAKDEAYIYNSWGEPVAAPEAYKAQAVYFASDMGLSGILKKPVDMFVRKDHVYLVDAEANSIFVLDKNMKLLRIISELSDEDGKVQYLNKPLGIFVDNEENMYVADSENFRVVKTDRTGKIIKTFTKPNSKIYPQDIDFKPQKLACDSSGYVYVLVDRIYQGIVLFDSEGDFKGFFGSNRVEVNAKVLVDYFWKRIMSKEQLEKMSRYVPVNYTNLDIDSKNFIYAVSLANESSLREIVKLNPSGNNVLRAKNDLDANYGDKEVLFSQGRRIDSRLIDISIDEDDFFYALDAQRNRVFMYDQDSNLIAIFGGEGNRKGRFVFPQAIETIGERILVLDSSKQCITEFVPTSYGLKIRAAFKSYNKGLYSETRKLWEEVLTRNTNMDIAYAGIGKAVFKEGRFYEAMQYFKNGYDRQWYSKAYKFYRQQFVRSNFIVIFLFAVLLLLFMVLLTKRKKVYSALGIKTNIKFNLPETVKNIFSSFIHPFEGFEDIKYKKIYSIRVSVIILVMFVFSAIFERQLTAFAFNYNKMDEFNIFFILARTILLFAVWAVVNWSLCTLFDGEGAFKEIWVCSSYAILPYVIMSFVSTFLSHYLIHEEGIFLTWMMYIAAAWSAVLMIGAIKAIHQYNFSATVYSICGTLAGMVIVLFIGVLFISLVQQLVVFISTVATEIMFILK